MDLGALLGFVFTLLIFSYLLGDNFLYRLAISVFVGLAAAFTSIVTFQSVIAPLWQSTSGYGETALLIVALLLAIMLLFKPLQSAASFTNLALAVLIGVGAAVAVVGAVAGTLIPLSLSTAGATSSEGLFEGFVIFLGVASSLVYFQYAARRRPDGVVVRGPIIRTIAIVGETFVMLTLGSVYGAAILTSLTVLVERLGFLVNFIASAIGGG
ncbi:hypothetical protein G4Y79_03615 [Phototrophicus methaneseepsis]|uniref:Uncharacterized protein n=1 Tax=Phototrophicus methaneseepsis TaxID=2710758 RepID=A0A7S8EAP0_9CHLR|nr:hypothetical protein [Phototrophicus methaneseepsis]QPC83482.1 hypothetical protein G4Y79_03615 [Phototrophicus methaneseepsis]